MYCSVWIVRFYEAMENTFFFFPLFVFYSFSLFLFPVQQLLNNVTDFLLVCSPYPCLIVVVRKACKF
ncbi:hypothetical protein HD806DRAFT_100124 [Xylariaceae sp. AK1471]|nr:hypothetical protein HD806DRAFT_100124 [Xylariaceae sp. AK1471]